MALSIFDDTTIAASRGYFPARQDVAGFLAFIRHWWLVVNSKTRFHPNATGNAIVRNDGKLDFLLSFSIWLENWSKSVSNFCLSKKTSDALVQTLRSQVLLVETLLKEDYAFVMMARLQSDPIERHFSRYRQMSGGRFLVSLREVLSSEKILSLQTLLKEDITDWTETFNTETDYLQLDELKSVIPVFEKSSEIEQATLSNESREVVYVIAGYVAKKIKAKVNCHECEHRLVGTNYDEVSKDNAYFNLLSRGGLTSPSGCLVDFICNCFAVLDYTSDSIVKFKNNPLRVASEFILNNFCLNFFAACDDHLHQVRKIAVITTINIFYNNKQKITNDSIRKDSLIGFKQRQRDK